MFGVRQVAATLSAFVIAVIIIALFMAKNPAPLPEEATVSLTLPQPNEMPHVPSNVSEASVLQQHNRESPSSTEKPTGDSAPRHRADKTKVATNRHREKVKREKLNRAASLRKARKLWTPHPLPTTKLGLQETT